MNVLFQNNYEFFSKLKKLFFLYNFKFFFQTMDKVRFGIGCFLPFTYYLSTFTFYLITKSIVHFFPIKISWFIDYAIFADYTIPFLLKVTGSKVEGTRNVL